MWAPETAFEFVMQPTVLIPSVIAASVAASVRFLEFGPRPQRGFNREVTFVVRVKNPARERMIELPDGTAAPLRKGENLLKSRSAEELFALSNNIEKQADGKLQYDVFRADSEGVKFVRSFPRTVNAPGGRWGEAALGDLDEVWSRYFYLFLDGVDRRWISYKDKLKLVSVDEGAECRLCGGKGTVSCQRCRGAKVPCDVCTGRRRLRCVWCEGSGYLGVV